MHIWTAAIGALGLWVVLAFVVAIPGGWVHLTLGAAATLIAVGIVRQRPAGSDGETG